ncbi:PepSY domain-containing protein [Terrihabitans sp. B22-R8]|uniref:PepSY domain-containing protein n=1 Tax=Terrihabitans sp. B22-R8 TaxID=3425128 RepID=UPI00403D1390
MPVHDLIKFALAGLVGACLMPVTSSQPAAGDDTVLLAQGPSRGGCLDRRAAIAAVGSGKARPLSEVRDVAEQAAKGEMINADLCPQNGGLAYVVTVLPPSGKVSYVTLDAASGRVVNVR